MRSPVELTGNTFTGTILALTQITLTDNITVNGRALARNADVTFIHDTVNTPSCAASSSSGSSAGSGSGSGSASSSSAGASSGSSSSSAGSSPAPAPPPPPEPSREIYCDAAGVSYNLYVGQDKQAPYDGLGLVAAYVDPTSGSKSCTFPLVASATATATTPVAAPTAAPDVAAAKEAAAKAAAAKAAAAKAAAKAAAAKAATARREKAAAVKAAAAKARAAKLTSVKTVAKKTGTTSVTHKFARPPRKHVGFTG